MKNDGRFHIHSAHGRLIQINLERIIAMNIAAALAAVGTFLLDNTSIDIKPYSYTFDILLKHSINNFTFVYLFDQSLRIYGQKEFMCIIFTSTRRTAFINSEHKSK